jgi:hypothetical protein
VNEILHANIFFFITSVSVILLTGALLAICWHVWKLSKTLRRLADKIEAEADEYIEASAEMRERITDHPLVAWLVGKKKHTRMSKREH